MMCFASYNVSASTVVEQGTCGDNLRWTLDDQGTLTISGTGNMLDYTDPGLPADFYEGTNTKPRVAPWYKYQDDIRSLKINSGVSTIGEYAFAELRIKSVTIASSVTSIGNHAFSYCTSLTSVTIPEGVTTIGEHSFSPNSLTSLTLPESLESIGKFAFYASLKLDSITIPSNVTNIGKYAFGHCEKLQSIIVESGNTVYDSRDNCNAIIETESNEILFACNNSFIPDTVTSLGSYAFAYCKTITSIEIPYSVVNLDEYAFAYCDSLTSIVIPPSVTSIGQQAFAYCESLKNIVILDSVTSIDSYAFLNISSNYQVYTIPGAYAEEFFETSHVRYICNPEGDEGVTYLGFVSDRIVISPNKTANLFDYINSNVSLNECNVTVSDEDLFLYDDGIIAALGAGQSTLTISNGNLSATVKLIATDEAENTTSITFTPSEVTVAVHTSRQLDIALSPANATDNDIDWRSSDDSIVTVDNGLVTAKRKGTAIITASLSSNQDIKATCSINVTNPLRDILLYEDIMHDLIQAGIVTIEDRTPCLIATGETKGLHYWLYPSNAEDVELSFTSSDPEIISIDNNGNMTAYDNGDVQITVSSGNICKTFNVKAYTPLTAFSLDRSVANIMNGETVQLSGIFEPSNTSERDIVWSSDKESVATVDENGLVTGRGKGFATITATVNHHTATCDIYCDYIPITGFSLEQSLEHISNGETIQLLGVFEPSNTTETNVEWSSSKKTVATVDESGLVTGRGKGVTTITATIEGYTATCDIYCDYIPITGFSLDQSSVKTSCGDAIQLTGTFEPDNTTERNVVWSSSKETVATVDSDGLVTVRGKGIATITATIEGYTSTCNIYCNSHSWDGGVVTVEPSCLNGGILTYTCPCGDSYTENIPANGHDWSEDYTVDEQATCLETGAESIHCLVCSESDPETTRPIAALGHSWETEYTIDVPASCTTDGSKSYHCARCGEKKDATGISATGHDFGEWETINPSTCEDSGLKKHTCGRCGFSETEGMNPNGHEWEDSFTVDVPATCTTDGSQSNHCKNCAATRDSEVVPAIGHKWNAPTFSWTTDNESVTATRVCKNDPKHKETETVKTTAKVTKPATYTAKGQTTYTAKFSNEAFKTQAKTLTNIDRLPKKAQTMTVKVKTATIKYSVVKKKAQTIAAKKVFVVSKPQGKVTYKKASGNKRITINSAGKFTVKKGLKKGKYKVKIKVTAAGNTVYKTGFKVVTVMIRVK